MNHRNVFRPALIAGSLIGALLFSAGLLADHSWGDFHWARTGNPFTLKLGDNVSSAWDSVLGTASSDWSQSSVLNTTIVAGTTKPRNCRPAAGRVEVCNSAYGNTGWLGVAQIWISGDHITQGTVKVNDTYYNKAYYNTLAWRNFVMCQEVGHIFGLDHQDDIFDNPNLGTCMDYTNDPSTNQHPDAHDYEELETIYNSHTDDTTTAFSVPPPAMNAIDFATPAQWGKVIRTYRDGRPRVYELDFGGGHRVVTFVYWTREYGRDRHPE